MSLKNGVLDSSRLDFGGPGLDFGDPEARFWRVLAQFFRDFPSLLAGNMQELLSNFKLKLRGSSWELQLPVHLTPTSNFNHDFRGRVGGGDPPPRGSSMESMPKIACFPILILEGLGLDFGASWASKSAALLAAPGVLNPTAFYACLNILLCMH